MELIAGKEYRTHGGRRVIIDTLHEDGKVAFGREFFGVGYSWQIYNIDGTYHLRVAESSDIVGPWEGNGKPTVEELWELAALAVNPAIDSVTIRRFADELIRREHGVPNETSGPTS